MFSWFKDPNGELSEVPFSPPMYISFYQSSSSCCISLHPNFLTSSLCKSLINKGYNWMYTNSWRKRMSKSMRRWKQLFFCLQLCKSDDLRVRIYKNTLLRFDLSYYRIPTISLSINVIGLRH